MRWRRQDETHLICPRCADVHRGPIAACEDEIVPWCEPEDTTEAEMDDDASVEERPTPTNAQAPSATPAPNRRTVTFREDETTPDSQKGGLRISVRLGAQTVEPTGAKRRRRVQDDELRLRNGAGKKQNGQRRGRWWGKKQLSGPEYRGDEAGDGPEGSHGQGDELDDGHPPRPSQLRSLPKPADARAISDGAGVLAHDFNDSFDADAMDMQAYLPGEDLPQDIARKVKKAHANLVEDVRPPEKDVADLDWPFYFKEDGKFSDDGVRQAKA
eukprot:g8181.t1